MDGGMKPIVRAVYYSTMFTGAFCAQEMMIYQLLHLELNVLSLKFLTKFYRIISNNSK